MNFGGIDIIAHDLPPMPKIEVSWGFHWISPKARADMNAWLLERFGTQEVAYFFSDSTFGGLVNGKLVMNPKYIAMLRSTCGARPSDRYTPAIDRSPS